MGAWSAGITGNDTARDLKSEYTAAFYYYEVPEALKKIDEYVRENGFDETYPEEWCDYFYSLADFMWKKGILTDEIKRRTLEMIDGEFGLEIWAESGEKMLKSRKQVLDKFKNQISSPQPAKKKIKPDTHTEDIFAIGDIVAVQLQTAGKTYAQSDERPMCEDEFHSYDGKYILMQKVNTHISWESSIVPEVKDHWLLFRLFDGVYDDVPTEINIRELKDASIHGCQKITSVFCCESSLYYFRKRKFRLLGNYRDNIVRYRNSDYNDIFWGVDKPWCNPDSSFLASMEKEIKCGVFNESKDILNAICENANRYDRYNYRWSKEENELRFKREEKAIFEGIQEVILEGGGIYAITYGRTVGVITVCNHMIDNFYILGQYQEIGLGTTLLKYVLEIVNEELYMNVPSDNRRLLRVCEKAGMIRNHEVVSDGYLLMKRA